MKKIKYLLLLCLGAICLTGCVKFNANMDIKKDKSMDFSIILAFDKSLLGESGGIKEEDLADIKKQGFTATKYSEGKYEGFKITKKIKNIDEVSSENDVIYDLSGMMNQEDTGSYIFKVVKGEEKNTYTAKIKFNSKNDELNNMDNELDIMDDEPEETPDANDDFTITSNDFSITSEDESNILGNNFDLSNMMTDMDLSFHVTLPNSAISSNATTKENNDKNLTWKLSGEGEEFVEFSFDLENCTGNNILLYVAIGVLLLVILAIIIMLTKGKNKKETVSVSDTQVNVKNDVNENIQTEPTINNNVNVLENNDHKQSDM